MGVIRFLNNGKFSSSKVLDKQGQVDAIKTHFLDRAKAFDTFLPQKTTREIREIQLFKNYLNESM